MDTKLKYIVIGFMNKMYFFYGEVLFTITSSIGQTTNAEIKLKNTLLFLQALNWKTPVLYTAHTYIYNHLRQPNKHIQHAIY